MFSHNVVFRASTLCLKKCEVRFKWQSQLNLVMGILDFKLSPCSVCHMFFSAIPWLTLTRAISLSRTRLRPSCGSLPLHYLLCNRTHPYPVTHLPIGLGYFQAKPSPVGFFFFQALNFLVESFGLLNDLLPLPSILDAGYPVFDLHLADVLFDVILPSVLGSSL